MNLKRIIREEVNYFSWLDEIGSDPIKFYHDNGYKSVGIRTHSNQEVSELLKNLYSLGYSWGVGRKEPPYLYSGDGNLIIWVTKFINSVQIQFSDSEYGEDGDLIIDNPFNNLNESEEEEDWSKWIREIDPMTGWDLYNNSTYGQTFTIKLKDSLIDNDCVYSYFPPDIPFDGMTTNVEVVSVSPNMRIDDANCDEGSTEAILLKFLDTYDGHEGNDMRDREENERISDICQFKCWWVNPGIIEIVS